MTNRNVETPPIVYNHHPFNCHECVFSLPPIFSLPPGRLLLRTSKVLDITYQSEIVQTLTLPPSKQSARVQTGPNASNPLHDAIPRRGGLIDISWKKGG